MLITCDECGMTYLEDRAGDRGEHRGYHDAVLHGALAPPVETGGAVWEEEERRIVLITPASPASQWEQTRLATEIVGCEVDFAVAPYDKHLLGSRIPRVFLYCDRGRIVGVIALELASEIFQFRWDDGSSSPPQRLPGHPPLWTVAVIWTHKDLRRTGVATRLFTTARYALQVLDEPIAWLTPLTSDGCRFAKRFYPKVCFVGR